MRAGVQLRLEECPNHFLFAPAHLYSTMKSAEEIINNCKTLNNLVSMDPEDKELLNNKLLKAKVQALEWVLDLNSKL